MYSKQLCSVGFGNDASRQAVKRSDWVSFNAADGENGSVLYKGKTSIMKNLDIFRPIKKKKLFLVEKNKSFLLLFSFSA